jgi:hypothetical protein
MLIETYPATNRLSQPCSSERKATKRHENRRHHHMPLYGTEKLISGDDMNGAKRTPDDMEMTPKEIA